MDDVAARLGRPIEDDEKARVQAFLDDATAYADDYCGGNLADRFPVIPAGLKAAVCAEVIRWLAVAPGVSREKVGDIETEFSGASTVQTLSPAGRAALRRYRRQLGVIDLRFGGC
ncbi:phage head-tail connector protein [Streptomyces sp. Tu6071]|uniref:phage head-tail connector protein n=1 Tax=Streptomyces sp. Tu6071 TaxID=355249 RepID=UPI001F15DF69|nr:phage head-tail connector protein [Streptomyces sp. Tu6071]